MEQELNYSPRQEELSQEQIVRAKQLVENFRGEEGRFAEIEKRMAGYTNKTGIEGKNAIINSIDKAIDDLRSIENNQDLEEGDRKQVVSWLDQLEIWKDDAETLNQLTS
jgi:hypothetical protein